MNDVLTPKEIKEGFGGNSFNATWEKFEKDKFCHSAYECCKCGKWFMSSAGFRQHNKKKHDGTAQLGMCIVQEEVGKISGNRSILEAEE